MQFRALVTFAVLAGVSVLASADLADARSRSSPSPVVEQREPRMSTDEARPQMERMGECPHPGAGAGRIYDPATEERIVSVVERVERVAPMRGMSPGVHVLLRTGRDDTIPVHLGPAWFVDRQDLDLRPGDTLDVVGSRVLFDTEPVLIARTVTKGDLELTLRDEEGRPVWGGPRGRHRR